MAYAVWSVVFGEQPTAAKWNILGTNDASFHDGTGIDDGVIGSRQLITGAVVQVVATEYTAVVTGAGAIPFDDTIPQNTEGLELMTQAITPKSATNILVIEVELMMGVSINSQRIAALFRDSTSNAIAAKSTYVGNWTDPAVLTLTSIVTAGSISSTTFKVRGGCESAGTVTMNGLSGTRKFGAIAKSSIKITEYKA